MLGKEVTHDALQRILSIGLHGYIERRLLVLFKAKGLLVSLQTFIKVFIDHFGMVNWFLWFA